MPGQTIRELTVGEVVEDLEAALTVGKQLKDPQNWIDDNMRTGMISRCVYGFTLLLGLFGHALPAYITDNYIHLFVMLVSGIIGGYLHDRTDRMHGKLLVATNPHAGLPPPAVRRKR